MANNRIVLCGNVDSNSLPWEDKTPIKFHMWGHNSNLRPGLECIRSEFLRNIPDEFCDLLEIATFVYAADQVATRGGEGVDNVGEDWYRHFFFRIPVRKPDFWKSKNVVHALSNTLTFLSDDEFIFDFVPMVKPPSLQQYFDFNDKDTPLKYKPEIVMLFSGGLDSLAGAIHESIINSNKIALVTHRPTQKFATKHRQLYDAIKQRARWTPSLFKVTINKDKNLNHEYTQRTRSFLYATLGFTFAEMFELSEVRFYENGVVSLNMPLAEQIVGTRATRTTHPKVLDGFAKLFSLIAARPIRVLNPFMWKTKKEILDIIQAGKCLDLIQHSTSCTHTWDLEKSRTHCGTCSQCIDRRFAVLAAGLETHDPSDLYTTDLLTSPRDDNEHRIMMASYVSLAEKISEMKSAAEFYNTFGMAFRALQYFPDRSSDSAANDIYDLYRRHAKSIVDVVDSALAKNAKGIRHRDFDPNCLLRLVSDSGDITQQAVSTLIEDTPLRENSFIKKGGAWVLRFAGGKEFIATPSIGMAYLHMLISSPNTSLKSTEMLSNLVKAPIEYQLGDAGESLDEEAVTSYFARLKEINQTDLPRAEKNNDLAQKDKLIEEKRWIEGHLKQRGLFGKRRDCDDRNRIRNRVGNAIKYAIEKQIAPYDASMAEHLKPPILKKGYELSYRPQESIDWQLE